MFNKALLAAVLAACSASALAAGPVANLKIGGLVTPPTCTINGAEQGEIVVETGPVSPAMLKAKGTTTSDYNQINEVMIPLTISCDAETFLTYVPTDTYTGADVGGLYRSVLVAKDKPEINVGFYVVVFRNMKVDNKDAYYGLVPNAGSTVWPYLVHGALAGWTSQQQLGTAANQLKLVSGKKFTADLDIKSQLWSTEKLRSQGIDLTEKIDFTGENVLAFNFGI